MANHKKAALLMYVISTIIGAVSGYFGIDIGKVLMPTTEAPCQAPSSEVSSQTLPESL